MLRPDFVSLRLFMAVARKKSLTKGAQSVFLTLPAASKRITELERDIGMPVFVRHPKGVELTDVGLSFVKYASRIFSTLEALECELDGHRNGELGNVRLSANTSAITQFLPGELCSFRKKHVGITVSLVEQVSEKALESVRTGYADFGVYASNIDAGDLQTAAYRKDRLVLVVPSDHLLASVPAVDFDEISQSCEFVMFPPKSSLRKLTEDVSMLPLKMAIEVDAFDSMCRMVASGVGVGVLPKESAIPYENKGLKLVELKNEWSHRELRIATRNFDGLSSAARILVEHLTGTAESSLRCFNRAVA
ncbi:LysR family transcriptional regulator [Pseudomonas helleri]|uniref:LysR family transcriptional regulator n=1 Tax=Pseudomonas helleri TaxID=1608996 RepID=UPI0033402E1B